MTLTFDPPTCDQFWECECKSHFIHRKGTMPLCLHEDPYAPGTGYGDSDWEELPGQWDENDQHRIEPWNVTEYCPICDAHEQDCSDARIYDLEDEAEELKLSLGEYLQLTVEIKKMGAPGGCYYEGPA